MSSCWNCLCGCCCTDWSQPVQDVGIVAGGVGVFGLATGNLPMAAVGGGVAIVTNCIGVAEMTRLAPTLELAHTAESLRGTVVDLTAANAAQAREIEELRKTAEELRATTESMQKQQADIHTQHEADLQRITDLNQKLEELQKRYQAGQDACRTIQKLLAQSKSEKRELAAAGAVLHDDERDISESLPLLSGDVADLRAAVEKNAAENERLEKNLAELKGQMALVQTDIDRLKETKASLVHLVETERAESELLQSQILERTREQETIQKRIEELMDRLRELMARVPSTT
jgi:chromosome segregation ATPase